MIPYKITYNQQEIYVSKMWLNNNLIYDNPNALIPIPKPYWKYAGINNIYLKNYSNSSQSIGISELIGNNGHEYQAKEIVLTGDIQNIIGKRYEDSEYKIYVSPAKGYCWLDGTTETIELTWMIVNIAWKQNIGDINYYTITNRDEEFEQDIFPDLYVSPYILNWLGDSHFDKIYISSNMSDVMLGGSLKAGTITIIAKAFPNDLEDDINLTFSIEELNINFNIWMVLDIPVSLDGVEISISSNQLSNFEYLETKSFSVSYSGLGELIEHYGIASGYALDIIQYNYLILTNYSEELISENSGYNIEIDNEKDIITFTHYLTNTNTTPNTYNDVEIIFGLNNFEVSGFTTRPVRFLGKTQSIKINKFESRSRKLTGPNETSANINEIATIGPFDFITNTNEEITPRIGFTNKGQYSNNQELSDTSIFVYEWDRENKKVSVYLQGSDESLNNLNLGYTLTLPMKIILPAQNGYPEASWEFSVIFNGAI